VLGRAAVPELLFGPRDPLSVTPVGVLLDDTAAIAAQVAAFGELRALMQKGAPEAPLEDAADRVLTVLAQRPVIGR